MAPRGRAAPSPAAPLKAAVARVEAKLDALGPDVAALLQATTRLVEAQATLLQAIAHPPVLIPPAGEPREWADRAGALFAQRPGQLATVGRETPPREPAHVVPLASRTESGVPHGTEEELLAPRPMTGFFQGLTAEQKKRALEYTGPDSIGTPQDINAALAAELALYAEEDEDPPPPPSEDQMLDQWAERFSMFRQNKMWLESWGPRPGQEGCMVPHELMQGGR